MNYQLIESYYSLLSGKLEEKVIALFLFEDDANFLRDKMSEKYFARGDKDDRCFSVRVVSP